MAANKYFNPAIDRLWFRFYFYLDGVYNTEYKMSIFWVGNGEASAQVGGLGFSQIDGTIGWSFYQEYNQHWLALIAHTDVVGAWHSIEMDYWRVGDTNGNVITTGDGEPSVAFWLDGVNITDDLEGGTANSYWKEVDGVYRLYADSVGGRDTPPASDAGIGTWQLAGTSDPGGGGTVRNIWFDRVSVSSLGRIGP